MLSFIVGQWSVWFVLTIMVCFLAGGLCGLGSARVAFAYIGLVGQGFPPTSATMMQACCYRQAQANHSQRVASLFTWRSGAATALLMGSVAIALFLGYGLSIYFIAVLCAASLLLTLAMIDASIYLLPDALTLPLLWGGLVMAWLGAPVSLSDAVAGATLGYLVPWTLFIVYKCIRQVDVMGHGDFKLLAALGAWLGWQTIAPILLLASVMALLVAMGHQRNWRPVGAYPFGPFLILSAVAIFVDQSALHLQFYL